VPSTAAAVPMRPPRRRCSSVCTEKRVVVCPAVAIAVCSTSSRSAPRRAASAAASTGKPRPIAADLESTTRIRCGSTSRAAKRAASQVAESCRDKWTATTPSAPSSRAAWYAFASSSEAAPEVVTRCLRSSARVSSRGVKSLSATAPAPPTFTCSGTVRTANCSAQPSGKYAVESVTTAMGTPPPYDVGAPRIDGDGRSTLHTSVVGVQHPLAPGAGPADQHHPVAVGDPAQARPQLVRKTEQLRGQTDDQPAVGAQQSGPAVLLVEFLHHLDGPLGDLHPGFAARRSPLRVLPPGEHGPRPPHLHLGTAEPLPLAEVRFPQPLVEPRLETGDLGERGSRVLGAAQVRADQDVRRVLGDHRGCFPGLFLARLGQLGVEVPRDPAREVVGGLPMAPKHQPLERHASASCSSLAGSAWSSNGIRG